MKNLVAPLVFLFLVVLLGAVILLKTEAELGRQDGVLFCVALGTAIFAFLKLCFSREVVFSVQDLLIGALVAWIGVSYFFISEVATVTKFLQILVVFALYFCVRVLGVRSAAFCLILVCGLVEAFVGLRQVLGLTFSHHHLYKITGTFYNPGPYGGFIAVAMSMALSYLAVNYRAATAIFSGGFSALKREWKAAGLYALSVATFMLSFFVIFATGSRAALIALAVCILIIAFQNGWFNKLCKYKYVAATAVLAGLAAIYFVKKDSADARLLAWSVMSRLIAENPLTGIGFGTFEGEYAAEQAEYFAQNPTSPFIVVADAPANGFNEYLQMGMELGLPALVLFLAILTLSLSQLWRCKAPEFYGLLALAIFAFFSYPFGLIPFQILLVLFLCRAAENGTSINLGRVVPAIFSAIIIAAMVIIHPYFKEKITATKEWREVKYFYGMELYDDCVADYAKLYPVLFDNPRFMFEYGHSLNKLGRFQASNRILEEGARESNDPMFHNIIGNNFRALGDFDSAEKSYRTALAIVPNRLYPSYLLMKLYADTGRDARPLAQQVIDFTPKVESQATEQMKEDAKKILL